MRRKKPKSKKATEASLSAVAIALISKGIQMMGDEPKAAAIAAGIGLTLLFVANEYRDVTTTLNSREVIDKLESLSNNGSDKK